MKVDLDIEMQKAKFYQRVAVPARGKWRKRCWIWKGAETKDNPNFDGGGGGGYGALKVDGVWHRAHRYIWVLTFGPTDMSILHECDTKLCVNLSHLHEGTLSQNMFDVHNRGRATGKQRGGDVQDDDDVPF